MKHTDPQDLPDDLRPILDVMARQFDRWRFHDNAGRDEKAGPDDFIVAPPTWPCHGVLETWSRVLRAAIGELTIAGEGDGSVAR